MQLSVDGLSKTFSRRSVLNGVSLSLSSGEVVGFVGPNGAGKSTTMKIMLGLVHADSGQVCVDGVSLKQNRAAYLQNVAGFVDGPPKYPILNARQHLEYVARLRGVGSSATVNDVLNRVGLATESRKSVSRFSMGMKQRVAIAMALIQSPKFLILDEPANGLDPTALIEFRELIRSLADETGIGVLISSHILSEVERLCNRVVFIRTGHIVKEVAVKPREAEALLTLRTTDDHTAAAALRGSSGIAKVELHDDRILLSASPEIVPEISKVLVREGIGLLELSPMRDLLESDYLNEFREKEMLS